MDSLWLNLRQAIRRLIHDRGFAAVALLTLALGIGVNTAMFSIVNGVLLQPLAFPQPQQLLAINQSIPEFAQKYPFFPVNAASFHAWQQGSHLLTDEALLQPNSWVLTGSGEPQQVTGATVTADIFRTFGVAPAIGRDFTAQDDQPNRNHVIILSQPFWQSQFHGDRNVIGRVVDLNGTATQIVGVMPASLRFPDPAELGPFFGSSGPATGMEIFQPAGIDYASAQPVGNFNYFCVARMKPGVTAAQVRSELNSLTAHQLAAAHAPGDIRVNTVIQPLRDQLVGSHALGLWMLLAAVGAILLIVCLNLANLLLVRVQARGHETALRVALGASRGRLIAETVTEGMVVALLGGALGVGAAAASLRWLIHAAPSGIPRLNEVGISTAVLGFSLLLALLSGVVFSLWPALRASRSDPQRALRAGIRGAGMAGSAARARNWLVGAQCALSAALLVVAGLLVASYVQLVDVNAGFQAGHVVEAELNTSLKSAQRAVFYHDVLAKAAALPGIQTVGLVDQVPTQGYNDTDLFSFVNDSRPLVKRPLAGFVAVSPDYFAAMGIPLLRGRTFTQQEMVDARSIAVAKNALKSGQPAPPGMVAALVSATTAARIWPHQDALGQQFKRSDPQDPIMTVVGVVADVRAEGLDKTPGLQAYLPYTFNVPGTAALVIRTSVGLAALGPQLRRAVWSVQPDAAIPTIENMDSVVLASVATRRFQMGLVMLFAICALGLAGLGIYGVVAYTVARRTGEIGIRLTLGAKPQDMVGLVLRQGMLPVVLGLIAGVGAAIAGGRLVASLLFGVNATDPTVLATVIVALLAAGLAACALPARRATLVDPLRALKAD